MNARDFESLLAQLDVLSKRQREKVLRLLGSVSMKKKAAELIESAAQRNLACPRCRALQIHLHGCADGLQRYRCVACKRTFNALTGTPLARLRYKGKWLPVTARI